MGKVPAGQAQHIDPVNPAAAHDAIPAVDPRLLVREQGLAGYVSEFGRKLKSGDLGSVPVVLGLIIIWSIFQSLNSNFLGPENLTNIAITMTATGMMAVGIIFVLLLGEIDLSVGSVSGVSGAIVAVLAVTHGVNEWLAIGAAVAGGALIGSLHGFFFAKIGAPAFAVTLSGLLFWSGAMLQILGSNGTVNIDSEGVVGKLTTYFFSDVAVGYGLAAVAVAGYFLATFFDARRREVAGVPSRPLGEIVLRTGLLAVFTFGPAVVFNQYKGLPLAVVLFLLALVATDFVLRRTTFGRQVFALGGSVEASRRAGINVNRVRITVFAIAGTFAAIGRLFRASNNAAAHQIGRPGVRRVNGYTGAGI
ncbi:sugar ABC transporter permease, partial [Streptomyces sp. NPDC059411]|uniref:ABC transporter permease subunit n=1 Tax=Streptomyces sp. NPDC059411 TaxID=3346825 RepID=UPI0036BE3F30